MRDSCKTGLHHKPPVPNRADPSAGAYGKVRARITIPGPQETPLVQSPFTSGNGQKLVNGCWFILDELVSEGCGIVRLAGGYHFKAIRSGHTGQYHQRPDKNRFSQPREAVQ